MRCDVDPDEVSARQPHDDEGVEHIEANGWGNEQVHGGDVRCVVTQEGAPSLGRRSTSLDHVLLYGPAVRCKPDVDNWSRASVFGPLQGAFLAPWPSWISARIRSHSRQGPGRP